MSSPGTGADITRDVANDLLHKLITESIKVQAVFAGRGSVAAVVKGFVTCPKDGAIKVSEGKTITDPSLSFGLDDVVTFKYGDNRAFPGTPRFPGTLRLTSALGFVYPDGAQVVLFEIEENR